MRIEVNVETGEVKEVPLTQREIDEALARKAEQDAYNSPENVAGRTIQSAFEADKAQQLQFQIEYEQENRIRVLEGKPQVTKAQYRDALIAVYRTINA